MLKKSGFAMDHNDLSEIQGGLASERYHLTSAELTELQAIDSTYLKLAGGTMSGAIDMGTNQINNVVDPTLDQDAATKKSSEDYTDNNTFWEIDGTSGKLQPKELDNIVLLQPTLTDVTGDNFIQNAFDVQPIITPSSLMNGKYNAINGALNFGGSNTNFLVGAELSALNFIGMAGVFSNHGNDKMDVNVYKGIGATGFAVTHNVRRLTMFNSIPTDIFSGTINMEDFFGFRANQARGNNVVDRAFQSYIDRPNFGTDKNQLFLAETGEGTGIKIGGLAGANLIYEDNDRGFQNTPIHWTGTGWTRNNIWGIYNYKHTPGNTADFVLDSSYLADNAIKSGKTYRVQFWIFSATAGTLTPKLGTAAGTTISADGEKFYEVEITANADDSNLIFTPSSDYDGQIDDIFLRVIENEDFARIYSPEEKKLNIAIDDEGTETDIVEITGTEVTVNTDIKLETGILKLKETTTPAAVDGYGKVYTKTDNDLYFQDGSGQEHVIVHGNYGEFKISDNTTATTIRGDNEWQALTSNVVTGLLQGMTFDAGSLGEIASTSGTGTVATINDLAHGLSVGDIISINGTTSFNGVFAVNTAATDSFTILHAATTNETGFWQQGASLTVGAGSEGVYKGTWSSCGTSATTGNSFDFAPYINTTRAGAATARRKFSNTDFGSFGGTELVNLVVGDIISFMVRNIDAANDVTLRSFDMNLRK